MLIQHLKHIDLTLEQFNLFNPLKIDHSWSKTEARIVSNLVSDKLPLDLTVGIHGTSLHAIRTMLDNGKLMPGAVRGDFTEGGIYFEPNVDGIIQSRAKISQTSLEELEGIQSEYIGYTENMTALNAKKHAFIYALGLEFTERESHTIAISLLSSAEPTCSESENAIKKLINQRKISKEEIQLAISQAQDFEGVIIGFNHRVLSDFKLNTNPSTLEAPRLSAPNGLETKYITAIVALGKLEKEFFDRLKKYAD